MLARPAVDRGGTPATRKILELLESVGHFPLVRETWKLGIYFCPMGERTM